MSQGPNDVIVRLTKSEDGLVSHEILLAVNDDAMIPEMEKVAEHIGNVLAIMAKSDAEIEYPAAMAFAKRLAS